MTACSAFPPGSASRNQTTDCVCHALVTARLRDGPHLGPARDLPLAGQSLSQARLTRCLAGHAPRHHRSTGVPAGPGLLRRDRRVLRHPSGRPGRGTRPRPLRPACRAGPSRCAGHRCRDRPGHADEPGRVRGRRARGGAGPRHAHVPAHPPRHPARASARAGDRAPVRPGRGGAVRGRGRGRVPQHGRLSPRPRGTRCGPRSTRPWPPGARSSWNRRPRCRPRATSCAACRSSGWARTCTADA